MNIKQAIEHVKCHEALCNLCKDRSRLADYIESKVDFNISKAFKQIQSGHTHNEALAHLHKVYVAPATITS